MLLSVGRLAAIKRLDVLLAALPMMRKDAYLVIAGDGDRRVALGEPAAALGLTRARALLGTRHDLGALFAAADVAVLSSEDNEGTPVSLIEAAAAGRPAVATDVGGVRDVVSPETGRLVPAADPRALAAALDRTGERSRPAGAAGKRGQGPRARPSRPGAGRRTGRDPVRRARGTAPDLTRRPAGRCLQSGRCRRRESRRCSAPSVTGAPAP